MNLWTPLFVLASFATLFGVNGDAYVSTARRFVLTHALSPTLQGSSDVSLAALRRQDRDARNARGVMTRLSPEEHLRRANIYHLNRAFDEAQEHWQALINYYPDDPRVAEALLGIGRSNFQSRHYSEAYDAYDRLARNYPSTKEGREGLNFSAASLLRLGKASEAAERYIEYVNRFPNGERAESAHLNAIDSLREAGRLEDAIAWVARTRQRFPGTPTETNSIFAQLRLEISEGNWKRGAYSLDKGGNREDAINAYLAVPSGIDSYYGWLASDRLATLADKKRALVGDRINRNGSQATSVADRYPAPYRQVIISAAKARKLDPRFVLAIIRQESVFRPLAKSPAGARGLLQLTIDAAQKYATNAGMDGVQEVHWRCFRPCRRRWRLHTMAARTM